MARYIDAELAIEKCDKLIDNAYSCPNPDAIEGIEIVRNLILSECETGVPTADVVPKSEEGAECPTCHGTGRIGTTDWLTKNISKKQLAEEKAKAIAEHEQHIKTDVAREIFEEIEYILKIVKIPSVNADGCITPLQVGYWAIDPNDYAELKKKYTEGVNG